MALKYQTKLYLAFFHVQGRYFKTHPRLTVITTVVVIFVTIIITYIKSGAKIAEILEIAWFRVCTNAC